MVDIDVGFGKTIIIFLRIVGNNVTLISRVRVYYSVQYLLFTHNIFIYIKYPLQAKNI